MGRWHPICVEARHAQVAQDEVAKAGFPVYLPMLWVNERHGRGGTRTAHRPMFGNYMFVKCVDADEAWARLTTARGVQRLMLTAGGRMGVVSDLEMHVIRLAEWENFGEYQGMLRRAAEENARQQAEAARRAAARNARELEKIERLAARQIVWSFTPQQQVKIKSGPFAGFYARLTSAVDERGRIEALVDLFRNSVRASLSAFNIEAL